MGIRNKTPKLLKQPTSILISSYSKLFENEGYGITDQAITKLFRLFPLNALLDEILIKVASINDLYSTNIYAVHDVASHIWHLDIDSELKQGSLNVVDKIAKVKINGKIRRNYSFASKYCSFHRPDIYPIYDSFVDYLLWSYKNMDQFANFYRSDLQDYLRYREIIELFQEHYNLSEHSLKEIDKFLWLYGREVYIQKDKS